MLKDAHKNKTINSTYKVIAHVRAEGEGWYNSGAWSGVISNTWKH